jgi:hypothetical protein
MRIWYPTVNVQLVRAGLDPRSENFVRRTRLHFHSLVVNAKA